MFFLSSAIKIRTINISTKASSSVKTAVKINTPLIVKSTLLEGTVMTGLNVFNGQSDPIALADDKYPEWLWKIPSTRQTEFTDKE